MREVFADTGYWIALINPADDLHQKAMLVTQQIFPVTILTTEGVLVELMNGFSGRGERLRQAAIRLIESILADPTVEVVPQTTVLFQAALNLYGQRLDKDWSHTDCASFYVVTNRTHCLNSDIMTTHPTSIAPPILDRPLSFEAFLETYPDRGQRCELIDGAVCEMLPTGPHEDIAGFLAAEFSIEIRRQNLPLSVPKSCLVKPHTPQSGYFPDVAMLDHTTLDREPLWPTASVIQNGATIPLIVEVVSTNWGDDYGRKCVDYEAMGIQEYWIVDFRGLGAVRYIGSPKQPTITIFQLIDGEYRGDRFIAGDRLVSGILPELSLSADEIFAIGE